LIGPIKVPTIKYRTSYGIGAFPPNDMSIVVLAALPAPAEGRVRRMYVRFPMEQVQWGSRREEWWDEDLG